MNRYILTAIVAIFILVTVSRVSFQVGSTILAQDLGEQRDSIPFLFYLGDLGRKHNCFFTIEAAWEEGEPINQMEVHDVPRSEEKKSLGEGLEHLRLTVPYLEYEVNESNPRIIHIIDSRLRYRERYGLESTIKNIDFEGKVDYLVATIGNQGISVSPPKLFFIGEGSDRSTEVHVKGEGLKVREALTNFVPLKGRDGRFLWIARTKLGKGEVTHIHYPWPGKMTKQ